MRGLRAAPPYRRKHAERTGPCTITFSQKHASTIPTCTSNQMLSRNRNGIPAEGAPPSKFWYVRHTGLAVAAELNWILRDYYLP